MSMKSIITVERIHVKLEYKENCYYGFIETLQLAREKL